jgi:drug/metabolite transporter (DMT)-like permease
MDAVQRPLSLPIVGFVFLGTINAVLEKVIYEQESLGIAEYGIHKFVKPFFFATMLSFGVSLSIPFYFIFKTPEQDSRPSLSLAFAFFLQGFFGYFQGMMSSITAALIGVSIDYMMRSATLLGVSLIAKFYFKRQFKSYEWAGMIVVAISLVLVGLSSVVSAGNSVTIRVSRKLAVLILILKALSQAGYSIKLSLEQYFTQQKKISSLAVSGFESFCGFLIGACVVLPIVNVGPGIEGQGLHEDIHDTLAQLRHNPVIIALIVVAFTCESVYQLASVALTEATSAVVRTLVESFRTFLIWVVQLGLFYGLSRVPSLAKYRTIGEEWAIGSWIQLIGYVILILGLMTYQGKILCHSKNK